jgi:putative effector of murein hydrolase
MKMIIGVTLTIALILSMHTPVDAYTESNPYIRDLITTATKLINYST